MELWREERRRGEIKEGEEKENDNYTIMQAFKKITYSQRFRNH